MSLKKCVPKCFSIERLHRFSSKDRACQLKWVAVVGNKELLQYPVEKLLHGSVCRKYFEQKLWLGKIVTVTAIPTSKLPDVPELEDTSSIAAESIRTVLMPEVVPIDVLPRKRHITYDVTESIVILEQDIPKEKVQKASAKITQVKKWRRNQESTLQPPPMMPQVPGRYTNTLKTSTSWKNSTR